MTTPAHKTEETKNNQAETAAKLLDATLRGCTAASAQAVGAAKEAEARAAAANLAANLAVEVYNKQALLSAYDRSASRAGGIGTLVGAGAGVAAAILVGKHMGFEPNAIAPLVGGGAVVGGAAGGLSGLGVNALLEWRAKNKK